MLKWVHTKYLYRDWSSIKLYLMVFTLIPFYGSEDIFVPREDYAEVLAFGEQRLQKKPKGYRTGGRKKVSTVDSKEGTP